MMKLGLPYFDGEREPATVILHPAHGGMGGKGAILALRPKPRLLHTAHAPHSRSSSGSLVKLRLSLSSVLKDLFSYVAQQYGEPLGISRIVCMLPAPYTTVRTKLIRSRQNQPFEVTAALLATLVREGEGSRGERPAGDEVLLGRDLMAVKVNGYATAAPFGKKGSELEIALAETRGDKTIMSEVRSAISEYSAVPVTFTSASLASFFAVRNAFPRSNEFLLLIGNPDSTELSLIRDGSIQETLSFSLGSNSVLEEIAREFGTTAEHLSAALSLYWLGSLSEGEGEKLRRCLTNSRPAWISHFEKAAAALSEDDLLPSQIFIVAGSDAGRLMKEFLRPDGFISQLTPSGQFIATVLHSDAFHPGLSSNPDDDAELLLDASYLAFPERGPSSYSLFSPQGTVLQ